MFLRFVLLLALLFSLRGLMGQEIVLDHVIYVVENLENSIEEYRNKGYKIKPGHLHANGLRNAHIKFANKSSLELMSVEGQSGDELAVTYQQLLKEGEGGVFICLSGISFVELEQLLLKKKYTYNKIQGKFWSYITFPELPDLAPFFFIEYHQKQKVLKKYIDHGNGCTGFERIKVEGNAVTKKFLLDIGLKSNANVFQTLKGDIEVTNCQKGKRSRIVAIKFAVP